MIQTETRLKVADNRCENLDYQSSWWFGRKFATIGDVINGIVK